MGCSISLILLVAAFEVILIGARQVVGGVQLPAGQNALQLPLKSITLGYRQEKTRLVMELRDSSDMAVADANARVETGRKWRAKE